MGLGDFISGIFGSKNEEKATGYNVDPNAYQYGGHAGGAAQASGAAQAQGQVNNAAQSSYANQQNNLYNRGNVGLDQAGAALGMATGARGAQTDALAMARARATGQAPSIAQMQADRAMQQSVAAQQSQAASARGPAGLALAQQNAAGNIAASQQNVAGQSAIAAAQERLAAEQAYAGQAQGIRATDLGQVGAANQTAGTAFGAGAQSGQLGLGAGQLGLGYSQLGNQIQTTQLAGQMNQQGQQSANTMGAQGINAQVGGQNASMNQSNAFGALGMLSSALGAAAGAGGGGGGGKAVGGHTSGGHPYLVGERGPELIVPKKDGFVFTAPQTAFINATMTPQQKRALGGQVDGYARADGGDVGGQPAEFIRAPAPATWGTAPDYAAQGRATDAVGPLADAARAQRIATYEQDLAARPTNTGAAQVLGIDLSGAYGAQGGLGSKPENAGVLAGMKSAGVQTAGNKAEEKKAGDAKKAEAPKPMAASFLGSAGNQLSAQGQKIDTEYHGGSGYVPPQIVQLPGRALGGPVQSGGDPFGGDQNGMVLTGGGMDVMGSLAKTNAINTQYLHSPGGLVSYAREEGGPVAAGGAPGTMHYLNIGRALADRVADGIGEAVPVAAGLQYQMAMRSPAAQALGAVLQPIGDAGAEAGRANRPLSVVAEPRQAVTSKEPVFIAHADSQPNRTSAPMTPATQAVVVPAEVATAPKKKKPEDERTALAALAGAK